jgi:hypothetical protein
VLGVVVRASPIEAQYGTLSCFNCQIACANAPVLLQRRLQTGTRGGDLFPRARYSAIPRRKFSALARARTIKRRLPHTPTAGETCTRRAAFSSPRARSAASPLSMRQHCRRLFPCIARDAAAPPWGIWIPWRPDTLQRHLLCRVPRQRLPHHPRHVGRTEAGYARVRRGGMVFLVSAA